MMSMSMAWIITSEEHAYLDGQKTCESYLMIEISSTVCLAFGKLPMMVLVDRRRLFGTENPLGANAGMGS